MAISRKDLLNELLPGLNALFDIEYAKYTEEIHPSYITEVNFNEPEDSSLVVLKHQVV